MTKTESGQPYELLLFDFDGTIGDTQEKISEILHEMCHEIGLPPPDKRAMEQNIGGAIFDMLQEGVKRSLNGQEFEKNYWKRYKNDNKSRQPKEIPLIPHMEALLVKAAYAGIPIAIVSNKQHQILNGELKTLRRKHTLPIRFSLGFGGPIPVRRKPCPDMVIEAIRLLGGEGKRILLLGDSMADICAAREANQTGVAKIESCLYLPPNKTRLFSTEETSLATYVVRSMAEVGKILGLPRRGPGPQKESREPSEELLHKTSRRDAYADMGR